MHRELDRAKRNVRDYQAWEYEEAERISEDFEPCWDMRGKHVLEIGCGLGGMLPFFFDQGAASVTTIDIQLRAVRTSHTLASTTGLSGVIRLAAADGARLPFQDDQFDTIISINVLEHVDDPLTTLAECQRVSRPGGLIFLYFPPFYSPWGPHLEGWINYPWPHLLFSDKTLLEAASRVEAARRLNSDYVPTAQVDWDKHDALPNLNRLTLRQFQAMIRALNLKLVQRRMLPVGRHFLKRRGRVAGGMLRALHWLAYRPLLREVITTKVAYVLTKAPGRDSNKT